MALAVAGAAPEWWSSLAAGDAVLAWYDDDSVYHERAVLWPMKEGRTVIATPDGDVYAEDLSGNDVDGPARARALAPDRKLPRLGYGTYRFGAWPSDEELRGMIREAHAVAAAADPESAARHPMVRDARRAVRTLDDFFGGTFVQRRLRSKRQAAGPPPTLPIRSGAPPAAAPAAVVGGAHTPRPGYVWLVSEPTVAAGGLPRFCLGDEVVPGRLDFCGTEKGIHR